jgi:hypothetical protein
MKFDLKKIKINPEGKVEISYKSENSEEGRASYDEYVVISDIFPHPDLRNAIKKLSIYLADANGLRAYRNLPHIPPAKIEKWNQKEIQDILDVLDNHVYATVQASGIALSGKDHDLAVIITGKHETKTASVAMNSPRIRVTGDSFGFEASVFDVVDEVIEEARKFVEEKKSAQMSMEFPEDANDGLSAEEIEEKRLANVDAENGKKKATGKKKKAETAA